MNIRREILDLSSELVEIRRDLHMHPELGFEEFRTAEFIEGYLRDLGLEPVRMTKTGVVAVLEGTAPGAAEGPTLMLRADIDALPIKEENDVPYKSQNDGVMHACGHDAHTSMLLIAAKVLTAAPEKIRGRIKFLFQPNEEVAGARFMVEDGCLEDPKVDAAMGIHIWTPLPSGTIAANSGGVMAAMNPFEIVVKGKGGHTGYPHLAIDPVLAAADIIQSTQRLQTREIDLLNPTALVFSGINSGTKNNIIPDEVTLEGTIRYLYKPTKDQDPVERFKKLVRDIAAVHKCEIDITVVQENDVVINDPEMVQLLREEAAEILGDGSKVVSHRSMAGEDFGVFARYVPAVFAFLGTANREVESDFPHHSSRFNIDEETMPIGVELFVRTALRYFDEKTKKGVG